MVIVKGHRGIQVQVIQPVLADPQAQPGALLGLTQLIHSAQPARVGGGEQLILNVRGANLLIVGHVLVHQIRQIQEVAVVNGGVHALGIVGSAYIDHVGQVARGDHQVEVGLVVSRRHHLELQVDTGAALHLLIELVVIPVGGHDGRIRVIRHKVGKGGGLVHNGQLELAGFGGFSLALITGFRSSAAFLRCAGGRGFAGGGAFAVAAAGAQGQHQRQAQQKSDQFLGVFHVAFLLKLLIITGFRRESPFGKAQMRCCFVKQVAFTP